MIGSSSIDEHLGRNLLGDLLAGGLDQRGGFGRRDAHDVGDVVEREALDRPQQEGLARAWRQCFQIALRRRTRKLDDRRGGIDAGGGPQLQEGLVQTDARIDVARESRGVCDERFEHGDDIGVAARLASAERPREAAKIRKMRRNFFCNRHERVPFSVPE